MRVHVGMFTDLLAQLYTLSYQNKCKILACVKTKCAFTYSTWYLKMVTFVYFMLYS